MTAVECEGVQELLLFYPRADLPRAIFRTVTRHLLACPACQTVLRDVQRTNQLLQAYVSAAPVDDIQHAKVAILARLELAASMLSPRHAACNLQHRPDVDAEDWKP